MCPREYGGGIYNNKRPDPVGKSSLRSTSRTTTTLPAGKHADRDGCREFKYVSGCLSCCCCTRAGGGGGGGRGGDAHCSGQGKRRAGGGAQAAREGLVPSSAARKCLGGTDTGGGGGRATSQPHRLDVVIKFIHDNGM